MAAEGTPLRVIAYFPKVRDFERREDGTPMASSLLGPDRIEARQQKARERLILGSEIKVLQGQSLLQPTNALKCSSVPPSLAATTAPSPHPTPHPTTDELRWCYIKSGVNHYEDCKSIVDKVVTRLAGHNRGVYRLPVKAAAE